MTKFMINNRTDALKTEVNLLIVWQVVVSVFPVESVMVFFYTSQLKNRKKKNAKEIVFMLASTANLLHL